jgi:hypothetical protein
MMRPLAARALLGVVLAALLSGCDQITTPIILGDLLIVSGDNQTAKVGTPLPNPLVVKVIDDKGAPVRGVRVKWEVQIGSGTLSSPQTTTGNDGQTSITATPGVTGQSSLAATIAEDIDALIQVSFTMEGS